MLVDTHAHLNFKDFQKDFDQVIKRSFKTNVKKIVCVSSNLEDSRKAIELAKKYPGTIFAAVGIHPHDTSQRTNVGSAKKLIQSPDYHDSNHGSRLQRQIACLEKLAILDEVVAIGECGLDYSPAPPGEKDRSKKDQEFLFKKQIKLAIQLNKPLLVHSRKAFKETTEMINKTLPSSPRGNPPVGVFHCYSAGKKGIEKVNGLGFFFGVDGNLTYDKGLQNVFERIPLEKILLETDCPWLAPEPFRNRRSEPAHIKLIAKCLANIKKVPYKKIERVTTQNAKKLFNF